MTSPEPTSAENLDEAREELARRLEEACQTGATGTVASVPETTGELIRLEGALHAAAKATEEMIAARKRANETAAGGRSSTVRNGSVNFEMPTVRTGASGPSHREWHHRRRRSTSATYATDGWPSRR
jgi:hypothetical protein